MTRRRATSPAGSTPIFASSSRSSTIGSRRRRSGRQRNGQLLWVDRCNFANKYGLSDSRGYMHWLSSIFLLVVAGGCTISQTAYGPSGELIHQIECGQALPGVCREAAVKKCPSGYKTLNEGLTFTSYALVFQCLGSGPLNEPVDLALERLLREQVGNTLKDPFSAHYRHVRIVHRSGAEFKVCGEVNAKNSYGAYIGYTKFTASGVQTATDYKIDW